MTRIHGEIRPDGPLIDIVLSCSQAQSKALLAAGRNPPTQFRAQALLDPGSDRTFVRQEYVSHLGLVAINGGPVTGSAAGGWANLYYASFAIVLPDGQTPWRDLEVLGSPDTGPNATAILGRDVLNYCVFHYDGPNRTFTLDFRARCKWITKRS